MTHCPVETKREIVSETIHGITIEDPYRWLEDQNSSETRSWIKNQSAYTRSLLDARPERDKVTSVVSKLIDTDVTGLPIERNNIQVYTKRLAGEQQGSIYSYSLTTSLETLLIDPFKIHNNTDTNVYIANLSNNAELLAYSIQQGGEDESEIRFIDPLTCEKKPDILPKSRYFGISIKPDNTGVYYGIMTSDGPRVRFHHMGTPNETDVTLFGEGYDSGKIIAPRLSESGEWLLITVFYGAGSKKTELYAFNTLSSQLITIVNDINANFSGYIVGNTIYIETNWDAPNGRVFKGVIGSSKPSEWTEIIKQSDETIESVSYVSSSIFVSTLKHVVSHLYHYSVNGDLIDEIAMPCIGSISSVAGQWNSDTLYYSFSSFSLPPTIYSYHSVKKTQNIWFQQQIDIDSELFSIEQQFYPSTDGTEIPLFVVTNRFFKGNGPRPTILYGYGGFGVNITPSWSPIIAAWVTLGGSYAVANLRGGGEYGETWHEAGMQNRKQNVFDDFYTAAMWLTANGYTTNDMLAIYGGSNGGLLVGATIAQHPELCRAAICSVPLLDMIRYHKFLVAQFWIPEYGSSDDPDQFETLLAYSPYHNIQIGKHYPSVMFVTGDSDTRVAPLHARKMTALLQYHSANPEERPVLLHYSEESGHAGGKTLVNQIADTVDYIVFLVSQIDNNHLMNT